MNNLSNFDLSDLVMAINNKGFSVELRAMPKDNNLSNLSKNQNQKLLKDKWLEDVTLGGKAKPFKWRIKEENLEVSRADDKIYNIFSFDEILNVFNQLEKNFKDDEIPLSNNVKKLQDKSEQPGFGETIYRLTGDIKKAQAASQLAKIFIKSNLFSYNNKKIGIKLKLINSPTNSNELISFLNFLDNDKIVMQNSSDNLKTLLTHVAEGLDESDFERIRDFGREQPEWDI